MTGTTRNRRINHARKASGSETREGCEGSGWDVPETRVPGVGWYARSAAPVAGMPYRFRRSEGSGGATSHAYAKVQEMVDEIRNDMREKNA